MFCRTVRERQDEVLYGETVVLDFLNIVAGAAVLSKLAGGRCWTG